MSNSLLVFITAFCPGETGAIHAYQLDLASGTLHPQAHTTDVENPFFLALSPDQQFLYAIHEPGEFGSGDNGHVAAYKIENESGTLTLLNRQPTMGGAACYVAVDATGQMLLAANYQNGTVLSFPIGADGSLGEAASFVQHVGSSVDPERQQEPHAHCFVISPDNRYAYSADLGIDKIMSYRLDPSSATLTANQQPFVRTHQGAGPRHIAFHPLGDLTHPFVYAINELDNSITMFDYQPSNGSLLEQQVIPTIPDTFDGITHCADLKITPDGRFLYGTNRGHDSIAAYEITENGSLALIGIEPSGAEQPQNLAITPDGRLLLCANMAGNRVNVFHIDPQTGQISPTGNAADLPHPSCIMIRTS